MLIILLTLITTCVFGPVVYTSVQAKKYPGFGFDRETLGLGYLVTSIPLVVFSAMLLGLFQWHTGEKIYTGYIYSAEDSFNKTVGHLRFAENAGKDSQPSFCAVKGSEEAARIKDLAGSGKKIKVTVPQGLSFQMWYGQCGLPASVEEYQEVQK